MFYFFSILLLLILQSSWVFFLADHFNNKTKYWPEQSQLSGPSQLQVWYLPAREAREAWEVRRANSHNDLGLLLSTRENCGRDQARPGRSYSDQMSRLETGVWPGIFENFEVLNFYQVLLSNITMIFLGTGTTGWERISYWRLLFFSTSKQKLLINVKASHRILLRFRLQKVFNIDESSLMNLIMAELYWTDYCISLVIVF